MLRVASALGIALALVVAVVAAGHGGDEQLGKGDLVWAKQPQVYRNAALPDDRVMRGVVRNNSVRVMMLTARDLRVRTADGDGMDTATVFAPTFIRGVFPENRGEAIPESEQLRVGLRARIEPGKEVPITVSWRERGKRASMVDYGTGSLPVSDPAEPAHGEADSL
jgi:hypothetical protein